MANVKITDLLAYTDAASTDVLPIVDLSNNVTKKVSISDLLKAAPLGSAAAPAIAIDNDPNTGIYSPGADQLAVSTGGTQRLHIDSSGRVGIGTSSPLKELHINATTPTIRLEENGAGSKRLEISIDSSALARIDAPQSSSQLSFGTVGTERLRIDSAGRLLVGTSIARNNFYNTTGTGPSFQIEGADNNPSSMSLVCNFNGNTNGPALIFGKSNSTALGSNTLTVDGNSLGRILFSGNDGTEFVNAAEIKAEVDGIPGANDMPGRLVFSTTADGSSTSAERMRIKSNGTINFSNVATYADNAAATSGGLVAGDVYRTSTGQLMIRY